MEFSLPTEETTLSLCHILPKFKAHLPQKLQQYKQQDTTMEIKAELPDVTQLSYRCRQKATLQLLFHLLL